MTVDLKIKVENGAVTITIGGQSVAPTAPHQGKDVKANPAAPNPGPVETGKSLGATPVGSAADQASPETGSAPGSGSGALVIGPIILSGLPGGTGPQKAGSATDQASPETGSAPASGSGVSVIGPIVIAGSGAGQTVKAGTPVVVPATPESTDKT